LVSDTLPPLVRLTLTTVLQSATAMWTPPTLAGVTVHPLRTIAKKYCLLPGS
jgi:hypothetical protein